MRNQEFKMEESRQAFSRTLHWKKQTTNETRKGGQVSKYEKMAEGKTWEEITK